LAADKPLISRSMANSASMRLTASKAIGEIGGAVCRAADWRRRPPTRKLAPRMTPAQSLDYWAGLALGKIKPVVAVERVGLQDAGVATGALNMQPSAIATC
jgi:hypothetical protein